MLNVKPSVLLTRPAEQSDDFRRLLGRKTDVVISPVMKIEPLAFSANADDYDVFVFASRSAVLAASKRLDLAGRHAIAVGDKTAGVAESFGMITASAAGIAEDLIKRVQRDFPGGKALFIHGEYTQGDVAKKLNLLGIDTDSTVAYRQIPLPLSKSACALICGEQPVILPLFSARSAAILSNEALQCQSSAPLWLVALSNNVLAAWQGPKPAKFVSVQQVSAAAMAKEILGQIDRCS